MSRLRIRRAAVLGAGIMGSGIAAHLAGAGVSVLLLDLLPETVPPKEKDVDGKRNTLAKTALEKLKTAKPALLFHPRDLERIQPGNFVDHLSEVAACDLVIEAVREDLPTKQALFAQLEPVLASHAVMASNTSGLSITSMLEGRSEAFRKRFMVTHFFNPVRYMRLLEIVPGPETDPVLVDQVKQFAEETLGKGVVLAHNTPNFVGNRIGIYSILRILKMAQEEAFTTEEIDAIFGPALGRPKSAVFRTADLVGLDTLVAAANTCYSNLPYDEERDLFQTPPLLTTLIERGSKGEKTGSGFYKKTKDGILALDLHTLEYRPQQKPSFAFLTTKNADVTKRIREVLSGTDRASSLAERALLHTLAYASRRVGSRTTQETFAQDPQICADLVQIDRAMRWGFGWELGPFEVWDALGVAAVLERMHKHGISPAAWVQDMLKQGQTFYQDQSPKQTFFNPHTQSEEYVVESPRKITLQAMTAQRAPVLKNDGAQLIDLGEGVACLEFTTKMNAIDMDIIDLIQKSIDFCERDFDALIIGNDATDAFSAGANLLMIAMAAEQKNWDLLEKVISDFQQAGQRIKYSAIPVVIAPFGLTLGGGAEITLHGASVRAHAELYMGLVETGVGLIPAGGGCKEMLGRALSHLPEGTDPFVAIRQVFETIATAKVSSSAEDAKRLGYLRSADGISPHRDHLLYEAKQTALGMAQSGYRPPRPFTYRLSGAGGYATLKSYLLNLRAAHQISDHDVVVGTALAKVLNAPHSLSSFVLTEQYILDLEREAFLGLCGEEKTRQRIKYMLQNNKPLRN